MSHTNPEYFHVTEPAAWDIIAYLEFSWKLLPSKPQSHQRFAKLLSRWQSSLCALKRDKVGEKEGDVAAVLLGKFHSKGNKSDRSRAKSWYHEKNGTGKKIVGSSVNISRPTFFKGVGSVNLNYAPPSDSDRGPEASGVGGKCPAAAPVFHNVNNVNTGTFSQSTFNQDSHGDRSSIPSVVEDGIGADDIHLLAPVFHHVNNVNTGNFSHSTFNQENHSAQSLDSDSDWVPEVEPARPGNTLSGDYTEYSTTQGSSSQESDASYQKSPQPSFLFARTGRVLRDVILESGLPEAHIARGGVIELEDEEVKKLFKSSELAELASRIPPVPAADDLFTKSISRFADARTSMDFRKIVEDVPYRPRDQEYDQAKHADAAWVNFAILAMLTLLASGNLPLSPSLQEGWFDSSLWSFLVDVCVLARKGLVLQRKEIHSWSLKWAEEQGNVQPCKASRFDGIIHTTDHHHLEFGAIEVSKNFGTVRSPKWVGDGTKLVKALHCMAQRICHLVDHDAATVKKVQVIGFLHASFNFQIVRVIPLSPAEESLLVRGNLRTVPTTIETLPHISHVLKSVHFAMKILDQAHVSVADYILRGLDKSGL